MNRLRDLESALSSNVDVTFPNPILSLEQYPTSPHLASRMVFTAHSTYDDIRNKSVLDLGCGTGILGIAAKLVGATHVVGIDIDEAALNKARENAYEMFVDEDEGDHDTLPDYVVQDVLTLIEPTTPLFDVCIMNPPFGTKLKHSDAMFVRKALRMANVVYSLHKSSTRDYFVTTLAREMNCEVVVLAELIFDIGKTYAMHKKESKDIKVDLLRFSRIEGEKKKQ